MAADQTALPIRVRGSSLRTTVGLSAGPWMSQGGLPLGRLSWILSVCYENSTRQEVYKKAFVSGYLLWPTRNTPQIEVGCTSKIIEPCYTLNDLLFPFLLAPAQVKTAQLRIVG
jgi:hypothetical protein